MEGLKVDGWLMNGYFCFQEEKQMCFNDIAEEDVVERRNVLHRRVFDVLTRDLGAKCSSCRNEMRMVFVELIAGMDMEREMKRLMLKRFCWKDDKWMKSLFTVICRSLPQELIPLILKWKIVDFYDFLKKKENIRRWIEMDIFSSDTVIDFVLSNRNTVWDRVEWKNSGESMSPIFAVHSREKLHKFVNAQKTLENVLNVFCESAAFERHIVKHPEILLLEVDEVVNILLMTTDKKMRVDIDGAIQRFFDWCSTNDRFSSLISSLLSFVSDDDLYLFAKEVCSRSKSSSLFSSVVLSSNCVEDVFVSITCLFRPRSFHNILREGNIEDIIVNEMNENFPLVNERDKYVDYVSMKGSERGLRFLVVESLFLRMRCTVSMTKKKIIRKYFEREMSNVVIEAVRMKKRKRGRKKGKFIGWNIRKVGEDDGEQLHTTVDIPDIVVKLCFLDRWKEMIGNSE